MALVATEVEPGPRWDVEIAIGLRPYDAQYSAVWRAAFELFVPIELASGPAYRRLLRERANAFRAAPAAKNGPETTCVALEAAFQAIPLPASAEEMGSLRRAFAAEIPDAAVRAINVRPALLGRAGPQAIEPLGVLSGMILVAVTRASYSAFVKWPQFIRWSRMSRSYRRFRPAPPAVRAPDERPPKGSLAAANEAAFDKQYGLVLVQPGGQNRVSGVTSRARSPAFGGKASETVSHQAVYRTPKSAKEVACAQSGVFFVMSDYDASLAVPGAQKVGAAPGGKKLAPQVGASAEALGKLFKSRPAERTFDEKASEELAPNVTGRSVIYELERGFKRPSTRLRRDGQRAPVFFPYGPARCTSPARLLYKMFQEKGAARHLAAQCFRVCGSFPGAPSLRVGLYGDDSALQFAARAQALSQLLVFMWSLPAVSPANRVIVTGVLSPALSVCQEQMTQVPAANPSYRAPESFAPRGYNSVLDNVVGTLALAKIVNVEAALPMAPMLRCRMKRRRCCASVWSAPTPVRMGRTSRLRRIVPSGRVATARLMCVIK